MACSPNLVFRLQTPRLGKFLRLFKRFFKKIGARVLKEWFVNTSFSPNGPKLFFRLRTSRLSYFLTFDNFVGFNL